MRDPILEIWQWQQEHRRPSWDEVFMMQAEIAATRSTCDRGPKQRFRKHRGTGACIASEDRRKVSLGYNGSVPGQAHCDDAGHEMVNESCVRTIHAEENAILNATFPLESSTIYTTTFPCYNCAKRIISVGIKKVVYQHEYKPQTPSARDLFAAALVEVRQLRLDPDELLIDHTRMGYPIEIVSPDAERVSGYATVAHALRASAEDGDVIVRVEDQLRIACRVNGKWLGRAEGLDGEKVIELKPDDHPIERED